MCCARDEPGRRLDVLVVGVAVPDVGAPLELGRRRVDARPEVREDEARLVHNSDVELALERVGVDGAP